MSQTHQPNNLWLQYIMKDPHSAACSIIALNVSTRSVMSQPFVSAGLCSPQHLRCISFLQEFHIPAGSFEPLWLSFLPLGIAFPLLPNLLRRQDYSPSFSVL